jgi:hypothetical protein
MGYDWQLNNVQKKKIWWKFCPRTEQFYPIESSKLIWRWDSFFNVFLMAFRFKTSKGLYVAPDTRVPPPAFRYAST